MLRNPSRKPMQSLIFPKGSTVISHLSISPSVSISYYLILSETIKTRYFGARSSTSPPQLKEETRYLLFGGQLHFHGALQLDSAVGFAFEPFLAVISSVSPHCSSDLQLLAFQRQFWFYECAPSKTFESDSNQPADAL